MGAAGKWLMGLLVLLGLWACMQAIEDKKPEPRPVKVITVKSPQKFITRTFPGKVEANQKVKMAFEVGGQLIQFPVLEGDEVKANQVIAKLNPKDYQANYNQTKAKLDLAIAQEARFKILHDKGFISGADYDRRVYDVTNAKSKLDLAQKALKDTVLTAPFDGVIIKKYVKNFQQIKPNEPIASLQNITIIDIRANIPESVIINLKKDQKIPIEVNFEASPKKLYPAKLKEFSGEADPHTQSYESVVSLPAPANLTILPGMTANLIIKIPNAKLKNSKKIYLIPASSVFQNESGKPSVWVVINNKVENKEVTVGELVQDQIQVLHGLNEKDVVVSTGVHFLKHGQSVLATQHMAN